MSVNTIKSRKKGVKMSGSLKKGGGAPSRPPPPKVGGGSKMSFSFKALEEEEDEELSVVTGKFDKQVSDEKERQAQANAIASERSHFRSKSAEVPQESTVMPKEGLSKSPSVKSQNSFERLKDIKGKIQDTIVKKKDELAESFGTSPKSRSTISQSPRESPLGSSPKIQEMMDFSKNPGTPDSVSLNDELDDDEKFLSLGGSSKDEGEKDLLTMDANYFDAVYDDDGEGDGDIANEFPSEDSVGELEVSEDYFKVNGDEGSHSEHANTVPVLRQRQGVQNSKKIKPIVPPSPVLMSKLGKTVSEKAGEKPEAPTSGKEKPNDDENNSHSSQSESGITKHFGNVHFQKAHICAIVAFIVFVFLPLPSYISGLIVGMVLASGGWIIYLWLTQTAKERGVIPADPLLEELPPMLIPPEMKEPKGEDGCYKGWMNEVMEYKPETYSINNTHSIFVDLEGTTLRLRRPKINVPKRAMWDEQNHSPHFVNQRHFDIEGSKVLLLPVGLVSKRLWSKKYPICVALAKDGKKHSLKSDSAPQSPVATRAIGPPKLASSSSTDLAHSFELASEQKCESSLLYLIARTSHEKEQWYRRLFAAAKGSPLKNHILEIRRHTELSMNSRYHRSSSSDSLKHNHQNSSDSLSSVATTSSNVDDTQPGNFDLRGFVIYMSRLIPRDQNSVPSSPTRSLSGKETGKESRSSEKSTSASGGAGSKSIVCDSALLPLNALLGRCFWDFLGDKHWANIVKEKLQKKLSKIHIPFFIEELKVKEISLGTEVPVIRRAAKPYLDENGFWIDLDVTYSGRFKMTIETKVNLIKLKETSASQSDKPAPEKHDKLAVTNSDEEDSAESSTDEEEEASTVTEDGLPCSARSGQSGGAGKTLLKYINKIAASKYFQSVSENKYVKKAMTGVSNTPLVLTVEVQRLSGTLAINIPPPPSDRLWYGFRGNPQLWLVAKPKVGEREVTMSHITEWIEKKLALEFQHVLVMPNMDDLVVPILSAGSDMESSVPMHQTESGHEV
ncbi:testis-expressed protein 2-like [Mya arenaria]|uniref:testis-expressed protein 2-like n=1 Tax=Mya arenaria TaxID=6604 RepID=UPI0022E7F836|nr:testis-expressed protein 2-like [Mya arenaria]